MIDTDMLLRNALEDAGLGVSIAGYSRDPSVTDVADLKRELASRGLQIIAWRPIAEAPRDGYQFGADAIHGPYILGLMPYGEIMRVRWWQSLRDPEYCNFLGDCGNAYRPTHFALIDPPAFAATGDA